MEALRDAIKDVRNDFKRLIELLTALNEHLSRLEGLSASIDKLVRELEEANENFKAMIELLELLRGPSK